MSAHVWLLLSAGRQWLANVRVYANALLSFESLSAKVFTYENGFQTSVSVGLSLDSPPQLLQHQYQQAASREWVLRGPTTERPTGLA